MQFNVMPRTVWEEIAGKNRQTDVYIQHIKGRWYLLPLCIILNFCQCLPFLHPLVKCGFLPASASNVTTAVSMQLLDWLEALMLESHISMLGFCKAVMWKNSLSENQVINLVFALLGSEKKSIKKIRKKEF